MYIEVTQATFIKDKKIMLFFNDGVEAVVDFNIFIQKGGIFSGLENQSLFEKFYIDKDFGVLKWTADIDISSESLHFHSIHKD